MKKIKVSLQRIGPKVSPILAEIEDALWEDDVEENGPQQFTLQGTRGAIKIFMSVLMDKMWERYEKEGLSLEEREKRSHEAGEELRTFFKKYTGVDTRDLYKL